MVTEKYKVFVYGSLKEGRGNHVVLKGATKIGNGETVDKFAMVSLGAFPMVFDRDEVSTIKGEVYEVDDNILGLLDALEGHPHFYERKTTIIKTDNGRIMAYIYVGSERSAQYYTNKHLVEDGVW